jgi:hypothetical protein
MPSAEDFQAELRAQIDRASKQGRPHIEVNAGELHGAVGGYPGPSHRMPQCCNAMAFGTKDDQPLGKSLSQEDFRHSAAKTTNRSVCD